jgi:hypothetical protein
LGSHRSVLSGDEVRGDLQMSKIGSLSNISLVLGGIMSVFSGVKIEVLSEVKREWVLARGSSRVAKSIRGSLAAVRVAGAQSLTEDSVGLDSLLDMRVESVLNLDFGPAGKVSGNETPSVTNLAHKANNELIFSIVPVSASNAGSKLVEKTISNLLSGSTV